jgi:hypothetical protein
MFFAPRSLSALSTHLCKSKGVGAASVEVQKQPLGELHAPSQSQNFIPNNFVSSTLTLGALRQGLYAICKYIYKRVRGTLGQ